MSLRFLSFLKALAAGTKKAPLVSPYFGWNDLLSKAVPPAVYAIRNRVERQQARISGTRPQRVRYRARNCRRSTRRAGMVYC